MEGEEKQLYEVGYHLVPTVAEDKVGTEIARVRQGIEARGGAVVAEEWPKQMELSYTMSRREGGKHVKYDTTHFGWIRFTMDREHLSDLNAALKEVESVLRFIVVSISADRAMAPQKRKPIFRRKPIAEKQAPTAHERVATEEIDKEIEKLIAE